MRFSIFSIVALVSSALAIPASTLDVRETDMQATDRLLFRTTLPDFITARAAKKPATLNWSSDGCSYSPDNPLGFDFVNSCFRHDFGYYNYQAQSRFSDANKLRIDDNFHTDLYKQCDSENFTRICKGLADVYYAAVRAFGKKVAAEVFAAAAPAAQAEIEKEIARREVGA